MLVLVPLALLVGLLLGLLGGGGTILAVPVFVYILGFAPKDAIAHSLLVVGITSLVGSLGHWRAGNVRWRVALIFGAVAMASAVVGARLALLLSGRTQLVLFAIVMLVASVFMMRGRRKVTPAHEQQASRALRPLPIALQASGVGIVTGLVGVGGGFMIVPALTLLGGLPIHHAIGTSLVIIGLNALAGFAGYLDQVTVDWQLVLVFTTMAIVGTFGGTALARHVPAASLRKGFAVFLIAIAAWILFRG
ncbi:MAG TPA: sulfite exporter TauE/SafE family protein [Gemmatimonadales bacterium]|nr:sulfite exporter TauE/SafE family protein [Gemmatimonadales bacterium]